MTAEIPHDQLADHLFDARWFGGKGRRHRLTGTTLLATVADGERTLAIVLAEVTYADGDRELYQLPLALYAEPQDRLAHATVGSWEEPGAGVVHAAVPAAISFSASLRVLASSTLHLAVSFRSGLPPRNLPS